MPAPVSLPTSDEAPSASLPPSSASIGTMPWVVGGLCLLMCWPLGIPALITARIARSAGRQRAEAVADGDLYGAARLLARSRRYRSISLGCSAAGVVLVAVGILLVSLA